MEVTKMLTMIVSIRDREPVRLETVLESIARSEVDDDVEMIVSDFGSADFEINKSISDKFGARYIYTESPVWNKAKALNTAFRIAEGNVLCSVDVDMVFGPNLLEKVRRAVLAGGKSCAVVQARDLPETVTPQAVLDSGGIDGIGPISRIRGRWGVGGLFAIPSEVLHKTGGLDERMVGWGAEDLDFAKRCMSAGYSINWVDDVDAKIYHVWHPSSLEEAESTPEKKALVDHNRQIYYTDPSIVRNATIFANPEHRPLISVVMSTFNRADIISESIHSILAQTVQDFELIIINDGSTDNTLEVLESFDDRRIRVFTIENSGIAAARNEGTKHARGQYIAVHDDDDLMVPRRLEIGLNHMGPGIGATYGSHANFDNVSGKIAISVGKERFGQETLAGSHVSPGHSTWLVRSELFKLAPYDEQQSSAVDNNLAIRLAAAGVVWKHTGEPLLIRRQHSGQITKADFGVQSANARAAQTWMRSVGTKDSRYRKREAFKKVPYPKVDYVEWENECRRWLPDHLVKRTVLITCPSAEHGDIVSQIGAIRVNSESEAGVGQLFLLEDARWELLARLRTSGLNFDVIEVSDRTTESSINPDLAIACSRSLARYLDSGAKQQQVVLIVGDAVPRYGTTLAQWTSKADGSTQCSLLAFETEAQAEESILEINEMQDSVAFEIRK